MLFPADAKEHLSSIIARRDPLLGEVAQCVHLSSAVGMEWHRALCGTG